MKAVYRFLLIVAIATSSCATLQKNVTTELEAGTTSINFTKPLNEIWPQVRVVYEQIQDVTKILLSAEANTYIQAFKEAVDGYFVYSQRQPFKALSQVSVVVSTQDNYPVTENGKEWSEKLVASAQTNRLSIKSVTVGDIKTYWASVQPFYTTLQQAIHILIKSGKVDTFLVNLKNAFDNIHPIAYL